MFSKTMSLAKFLADTSTESPIETPLFEMPSFDFSNLELSKSIDSFNKSLTDLNTSSKDFFDLVKTIHGYITNPILIWNGFISISFWVCLIICLSSFLIYLMSDRKKDLNRSKFSFALWIILKMLDMSIKGR